MFLQIFSNLSLTMVYLAITLDRYNQKWVLGYVIKNEIVVLLSNFPLNLKNTTLIILHRTNIYLSITFYTFLVFTFNKFLRLGNWTINIWMAWHVILYTIWLLPMITYCNVRIIVDIGNKLHTNFISNKT